MSYRNLFKLIPLLVLLTIFYLSFKSDPPSIEVSSEEKMMRLDMREVINAGGKVDDYDDNRKPSFSRAYQVATMSADSWSYELYKSYVKILLDREWVQVKKTEGGQFFCKRGAYASLLYPHNGYGVSIGMEFDESTIIQCKKLTAMHH